MAKEKKIARIRQPIHLTLSKETINLLKNTGNNASKVIDSLVKDAFSESKPLRVLISESGWARRDSNSRPPPCEGDVITS
jgi:sulfopyruvate decarboxylase TPP-binding subunit